MARRSDAEMAIRYAEWKGRIYDPEFRVFSYAKQAAEIGVSDQAIANWTKAMSNEEWAEILEVSRKNISKAAAQVDSALLRKALEGDVPAMKLWKESIEGWSPKTINENLNKNADLEGKTDAELRAEILKAIPKEELEAALKEKELKVVEPEKKAQNGEG